MKKGACLSLGKPGEAPPLAHTQLAALFSSVCLGRGPSSEARESTSPKSKLRLKDPSGVER